MHRIKYAAGHQAISALVSIVCIPARYCRAVSTFKEGTEFVLEAVKPIGRYPCETRWRVIGPVSQPPPKPLDSSLMRFLLDLWPFATQWLSPTDDLYWFSASLLDDIDHTVLAETIELERKQMARKAARG